MYNSPVDTLQSARQTNTRAVAQSGSALAWGARGRGFESRLPDTTKKLGYVSSQAFLLYLQHNLRTHDPVGEVKYDLRSTIYEVSQANTVGQKEVRFGNL